jgi:hypothetical protein
MTAGKCQQRTGIKDEMRGVAHEADILIFKLPVKNELSGSCHTRVIIILFDYREFAEVSPLYDKRPEHWRIGL